MISVYIFFWKLLEIAQLDEKSETGRPQTGIWLDKLGIVKLIFEYVTFEILYRSRIISWPLFYEITSILSESNRILNLFVTIADF